MDSRELGLVLARQLLAVEDLHYGLWEPDLPVSLTHLAEAQQRYNRRLIAALPPADGGLRVLDVGCGTGRLMQQLHALGYAVEGVVPAPYLHAASQGRFESCGASAPQVQLEKFETADFAGRRFDVVLFSESFQYVPLEAALAQLERVVAPGGTVVISDFFKTDAEGDGGPGDRSFKGGHPLRAFRERMARSPFVLVDDVDLTPQIAPNLELVDDLLMRRTLPAACTLRAYLGERHPWATRVALWLLRKKLDKVRFKYFSGHRCRAVFERYKSYRLMRWRYAAAG
jgi:SAM-dependent methyltransferase